MTALDDVAVDDQLVEHLRTGGTPPADDRVATGLAAWRDEVQQ